MEWFKTGIPALQLAESLHNIRRCTYPWNDENRSRWLELGVFGDAMGDAKDDAMDEVPTVRTLGVQLSKLSVEGEMGEGEICVLVRFKKMM